MQKDYDKEAEEISNWLLQWIDKMGGVSISEDGLNIPLPTGDYNVPLTEEHKKQLVMLYKAKDAEIVIKGGTKTADLPVELNLWQPSYINTIQQELDDLRSELWTLRDKYQKMENELEDVGAFTTCRCR